MVRTREFSSAARPIRGICWIVTPSRVRWNGRPCTAYSLTPPCCLFSDDAARSSCDGPVRFSRPTDRQRAQRVENGDGASGHHRHGAPRHDDHGQAGRAAAAARRASWLERVIQYAGCSRPLFQHAGRGCAPVQHDDFRRLDDDARQVVDRCGLDRSNEFDAPGPRAGGCYYCSCACSRSRGTPGAYCRAAGRRGGACTGQDSSSPRARRGRLERRRDVDRSARRG